MFSKKSYRRFNKLRKTVNVLIVIDKSILGNKIINSSSRRIKTNNNQELKINLRQIINSKFLIIDDIRKKYKKNQKWIKIHLKNFQIRFLRKTRLWINNYFSIFWYRIIISLSQLTKHPVYRKSFIKNEKRTSVLIDHFLELSYFDRS